MRTDNKKILLAGLPGTGKSTFIAALWYFVCNHDENRQSLRLDHLSKGEDQYLNQISSSWLECKQMPRTNLNNSSGQGVVMSLVRCDNNKKIELDIPDFNGETFNEHFDSREWEIEFDNIINSMDGMLLFVNPADTANTAKLIFKEQEYLRMLGEEISVNDASENELNPFLTKKIPNQVKLIDLLQFLLFNACLKSKPFKIALVVSAWDKIQKKDKGPSPEKWLEKNLPMLHQFIQCNQDQFEVEYFGISAQGGEYESQSLIDLLEIDPLERIIVKQNDKISKDIALPILWATA